MDSCSYEGIQRCKSGFGENSKEYPFNLIQDKVIEIHSKENKVVCENYSLTYDYLVVAFGAEKLKHKGINYTLSICGKPEMAAEIRDKVDSLVKKSSGKISIGFGGNPKDKSAVRGMPAFELMFNIHNYLKTKKLRNKFELTFFAPMDAPGARMGQGTLVMMDKMFTQFNIRKRFGKKIKEFVSDGVIFEDDSKLDSDFTMFIAAVMGIGLYIAISWFHISFWFVLLTGTLFSLCKRAMEKTGISYTCSKCLECVAACPNGRLTYKI